jgi:hypothetical protein
MNLGKLKWFCPCVARFMSASLYKSHQQREGYQELYLQASVVI